MYVKTVKWCHVFMKGATRGLRDRKQEKVGGLEGKLSGDYLKLIPGLCLEDRMN